MKKLLFFFSTILILLFSLTAYAAELKIGIVDFQKVNQETQISTMLRDKFQSQIKQFGTEFNLERQKLLDIQAKLTKNPKPLSESEKVALQSQLKQAQADMASKRQQWTQKMQAFRSKIIQQFWTRINTVVTRVAKAQGLNLVLQKSSVAYGENMVDITDQVVAELKQGVDGANANADAEKAQDPSPSTNGTVPDVSSPQKSDGVQQTVPQTPSTSNQQQ